MELPFVDGILEFVPPIESARFALFVGSDTEHGKTFVYNDLGSAKNAFHYKARERNVKVALILERVEDAWYVLYNVPMEARSNGYEPLPWYKDATSWRGGGRKVAKPMTREEYAEWRVAVERERNPQY